MESTERLPKEIVNDKKLLAAIRRHGPLDVSRWRRPKQPFHSLIRSIVYQQVSGSAAASILKKVMALFGDKFPTPQELLDMSEQKLRSAGLSIQKVAYVKDLSKHFADGSIEHRRFPRMTNEEIIEHLTRVKGIGVWTAHMFLIFTLKRPDILPTLDLGIRKGFQVVYGLKKLPEHVEMERRAKNWRRHASLASLYLWQVSDGSKKRRP